MSKRSHGYITLGILFFIVALTTVWYASSPSILEAGKDDSDIADIAVHEAQTPSPRVGKYIVVHLDTMKLEMFSGENLIETVPLISQGKPGSYYETIGGEYINDYKVPNHFSSIGHVYMPYSIHVFGNFFIHGIPYYPDGTKVSSAYSGGCVRVSDDDIQRVYDFVEHGTPIIITRDDKNSFAPTVQEEPTRKDMGMTRLMAAAVSLEFLTQDNQITGPDGNETTRRKLIPKLLIENDDRISALYAQALGEKQFVKDMNDKAKALGLTSTVFTSTQEPVLTSNDDYIRFMSYIDVYKSYLRKVDGSTEQVTTPPIN
jgi:hypothetical protein